MLFFLLFSTARSTVCELFSSDADTCTSVFGCSYCVQTGKCLATSDEKFAEKCKGALNAISGSQKKLGKCYTLYTEDGCARCVNRTAATCGWCQSLGICAEGTADGANGFDCPKGDWIFNKVTCEKSVCAKARTEKQCKSPCTWNAERGVCLIERANGFENAAEIDEANSVTTTKRTFIFALTGLGIVCLVALVLGVYRYSRPLYQKLPGMSFNYNLDDLPTPVTH